jgi:hypothetical protein
MEVLGAGERSLVGSCSNQPEQIGYRSRSKGGRPEPANILITSGEPIRSMVEEMRDHVRSPPHGSATCTTRRGCGGERDGRTMVAFVSGWCGSHGGIDIK